MEKCKNCGTEKQEYDVFWCGEWEKVELCPNCDVATEEESEMLFLQ